MKTLLYILMIFTIFLAFIYAVAIERKLERVIKERRIINDSVWK